MVSRVRILQPVSEWEVTQGDIATAVKKVRPGQAMFVTDHAVEIHSGGQGPLVTITQSEQIITVKFGGRDGSELVVTLQGRDPIPRAFQEMLARGYEMWEALPWIPVNLRRQQ